jgi:hypothetical protein
MKNALLALLVPLFFLASPLRAASIDHASQVVLMVYDIGLYTQELDRIMAQADSRGIFTSPNRAREHASVRTAMIAQREAVLRLAAANVAAHATDPQLDALLAMAASPSASVDQTQLNGAVAAVKAGFEQAVWDQLSRSARGNREFPCTKEQRFRCS